MSEQKPESEHAAAVRSPARQANWQTVGKLSLLVLLMFGFGYAMIPIYKAFCDITGINLLTSSGFVPSKFARQRLQRLFQIDNQCLG